MNRSIPHFLQLSGLYLFAFSLPISFVPAEFGVAISFLGWLADGAINRTWRFHFHPFMIPAGLYLAWNLISAFAAVRPMHTLAAVADNEWSILILLMLYWNVSDTATLGRIVKLFFFSSVLASAYAVWQTFAGIELWRNVPLDAIGSYYRAVGFAGFYLTFAGFAMTVFFLAANIAIETKGGWRFWSALTATLSFAAVMATFARSIWLSFGAAIPMMGFLRDRRKGMILTATFVLLGLALFSTVPTMRDRISSIVDPAQNETRLNLWKSSMGMIAARPWLGIGQDNFMTEFPDFRVPGTYDTIVHPHNDYLNVAVNSGIPGLFFFLALWVMVLRSGVAGWRNSDDPLLRGVTLGGVTAIAGFLVGGLFQNYYGTFANCLGWWFVAGLMLAAGRLGRRGTASR